MTFPGALGWPAHRSAAHQGTVRLSVNKLVDKGGLKTNERTNPSTVTRSIWVEKKQRPWLPPSRRPLPTTPSPHPRAMEEEPTSSWRSEIPEAGSGPAATVAATVTDATVAATVAATEPAIPQRRQARLRHGGHREKHATESIRLKHGLRHLLLTSPEHWLGYDAVGTGQGGMLISPGEVVDVPVPPLDDGQLLSYRIRCEDGLDIGFELLSIEGGGAVATELELPLEAWRRGEDFEGELRLRPAARCVVRFDNSFSWFQTRTVHFAIEAQPVRTVTATQRRACEQAEERSLRKTHAGQVRAAEAEAARRVHALHAELQQAEAELGTLVTARDAVEAAVEADAAAAAAELAAAATAAADADAADAPGVAVKTQNTREADEGGGEVSGGDEGGEGGEVEVSLSHLRRLWRRLAQLDAEASVVASRVAPGELKGELLLREVTLRGQTLRHFGLFGAHSDLDHVVTLCLLQLQQLQQQQQQQRRPPPQQQLGRPGAPAAAPQPTGGEPPERSEPTAPAETSAEVAGATEVTPEPTPAHAPASTRDEAGGPPGLAATTQPLDALEKLQWLSAELLRLDDAATMDVAVLDQDEYQINSVCVRGHTLQSFSNVTAHTDVGAILAVCTNIVTGSECCPAPAPVLSGSTAHVEADALSS